jgi:hypothetical protein
MRARLAISYSVIVRRLTFDVKSDAANHDARSSEGIAQMIAGFAALKGSEVL